MGLTEAGLQSESESERERKRERESWLTVLFYQPTELPEEAL